MRLLLAAVLAPLAARAHPGHDAGSGSAVHWLTQHAPELGALGLVLALSAAGLLTFRIRSRGRR